MTCCIRVFLLVLLFFALIESCARANYCLISQWYITQQSNLLAGTLAQLHYYKFNKSIMIALKIDVRIKWFIHKSIRCIVDLSEAMWCDAIRCVINDNKYLIVFIFILFPFVHLIACSHLNVHTVLKREAYREHTRNQSGREGDEKVRYVKRMFTKPSSAVVIFTEITVYTRPFSIKWKRKWKKIFVSEIFA